MGYLEIRERTMGSERKFCCNFFCRSNTAAAEGFAIMHLIILGITEFFLVFGISWHATALWQIIGFFTYWIILSILVVIRTNGHRHRLLLVCHVLGWLGVLGFAACLYLYNGYHEIYLNNLNVVWFLGCVWLLVLFWYVLCIYGAMLEAKETNQGIIDGPSEVEMGQPGTEIIASSSLPYSWISWRLGVEMGKPTIDLNVEPSDPPPSYYQLFPTMEQSSKWYC